MAKNEYRSDVINTALASLTRHLEKMEEDRWEFVTVLPTEKADEFLVVLRRPKRGEARMRIVGEGEKDR